MLAKFTIDAAGSAGPISKTYDLSLIKSGPIGIQIGSISAGNVLVEGTIDEVNWVTVVTRASSFSSGNPDLTSITAAGLYYTEQLGYVHIRFTARSLAVAVMAVRFVAD